MSYEVDWNNVVSAVATDDGLLVTERGADGTVGETPIQKLLKAMPGRQTNASLESSKTLTLTEAQKHKVQSAVQKLLKARGDANAAANAVKVVQALNKLQAPRRPWRFYALAGDVNRTGQIGPGLVVKVGWNWTPPMKSGFPGGQPNGSERMMTWYEAAADMLVASGIKPSGYETEQFVAFLIGILISGFVGMATGGIGTAAGLLFAAAFEIVFGQVLVLSVSGGEKGGYTFVGQEWVDGKWKNHLLYWQRGTKHVATSTNQYGLTIPAHEELKYIDVWSPPLPWGPVPQGIVINDTYGYGTPSATLDYGTPSARGVAPQLSPFSPGQSTAFLRPQRVEGIDWNNVVGAVAREDGLEVTERQADGTIGSVFLPRG